MFKKIILLLTVIMFTAFLILNCQTASDATEKDKDKDDSSAAFTAPVTGPVSAVPAVTITEMSLTAGSYFPASGATGVNIDTLLRIGFDSAPTINATGTISIYTAAGTLVDTINLADAAVTAQAAFQALTTATVNTKVNIIGNTPGSGVL